MPLSLLTHRMSSVLLFTGAALSSWSTPFPYMYISLPGMWPKHPSHSLHLLCKVLGPKHQAPHPQEAKGFCQLGQMVVDPLCLPVASLHQLWVPWHLPKFINLCMHTSWMRNYPWLLTQTDQSGQAATGPRADLPAKLSARRILAKVVTQPVHPSDEKGPNSLERGFHGAQQCKGKLGQLWVHLPAQAYLY